MIIKYRILLGLLLIFTFFLVVGNLYIYQQQRISLIAEHKLSKQSEVKLLSQLAREALISENYSLIEWFFNYWGDERSTVISLSLENEAGFFLSQYQRQAAKADDSLLTIVNIITLNNEAYKITLVSDISEINDLSEKLLRQLALVTCLATIILAVSIWYLFQQIAIGPLQVEVQQRQKVENELKLSNEKLQLLACHDPLTGLRNRLNMKKDIEAIIQQHNKHHSPFAVLMFDIDWFKKVNDKLGHDVGDFVLIEVARLLELSIRQEDRIYRSGGEEFVIVLNRISYEDSIDRAEKIRTAIENHVFKVDSNEISKTISGGLYHSTLLKIDKVERILKLVDNALYQSKENGRNRISTVQTTV